MATVTQLSMYRGDQRDIEATLTLAGAAWEPPVGATLRFTAKRNVSDTDAQAVIAKDTTDGISVAAEVATVVLAPGDTSTLTDPENLYCDIQAAGDDWGPWTVAVFRLEVKLDVTVTSP